MIRQRGKGTSIGDREDYYLASGWQLMWRKLRRHHLAIGGGSVLALLFTMSMFAEFVTPYSVERRFANYHPPSRIRLTADSGRFPVRPFVYGITSQRDPETFAKVYAEDRGVRYPIRLFAAGESYRLLGLIPARLHLFGVDEPGGVFLFGTDVIGRDVFSRNLYAARVSLLIGLVGVFLTFAIGVTLGGISGYFGGRADMLIQRAIEFLMSIPTIPLWLALSAAMPRDWSILQIYFGIVVILSLVGWGRLARVVRGKLLELRALDYVMAARLAGLRESGIIGRHLLPNFAGYLIVNVSLDIPGMILAETALSFLGLGLRSPAVSWGVLLQDAQKIRSVAAFPWLIIPALFVVITVLAFNFVGDGLRGIRDITEKEVISCLRRHDSSYTKLRYFQLNHQGKLHPEFGFSPREVQILHCLALALIGLNLNEMTQRQIGIIGEMNVVSEWEMTDELRELKKRLMSS